MNPPITTRHTGPEAASPAAPLRPEDPAEMLLTAEDLIGDLDPGWLDWRASQADS